MTNRVGNRDRPALGNAQKRETIHARRFNHRFEVFHPGVEGKIGDLPIRKAVTAFVITNEGVIARKLSEQVTPDWTAPVKFEMAEPVRGFDQRRSGTDCGVSDAHAIMGGAKMD